jgi:hypothetical protein
MPSNEVIEMLRKNMPYTTADNGIAIAIQTMGSLYQGCGLFVLASLMII